MSVMSEVPGRLKVIRAPTDGKYWVMNDTTNLIHAGPFETEAAALRIAGTYPEHMRPEVQRKKRLADYMREYRARDLKTLDKARRKLETLRVSLAAKLAVLDEKQQHERDTLASKHEQERDALANKQQHEHDIVTSKHKQQRDKLRHEWKERLAVLEKEVKHREAISKQ